MYAFTDQVTALGLTEGEAWASDVHRIVAENLCVGRSGLDTVDQLREVVSWVNQQDADFLRTATIGNLVDAGLPLSVWG